MRNIKNLLINACINKKNILLYLRRLDKIKSEYIINGMINRE